MDYIRVVLENRFIESRYPLSNNICISILCSIAYSIRPAKLSGLPSSYNKPL